MTHRDADPLPPTLADPPGHARHVRLPWPQEGWDSTTLVLLLSVLTFPLSLLVLGGVQVWAITRPAIGRVSPLGWASRLSWLAAWLTLGSAVVPAVGLLAGGGLALAFFGIHAASHYAYLRGLTRKGSRRRRQVDTSSSVEAGALVLHALMIGFLLFVGAERPLVGAVAVLGSVAWSPLAIVALHWLTISSFWTERDGTLDRSLAKTRLLGVPATWAPFGYQWRGAGPMREWRVIADTARVPAALRFEVTIRGTRPARIRKREAGDPAGVRLSDPILSSTLVVEGIDAERADAMLAEVHEVLLPLIHGRSAMLERGVFRVDLYPEPPMDEPWRWMELTLRRMVAVSEVIEGNVIGEPPRTDEVLRQLQEISDKLSS